MGARASEHGAMDGDGENKKRAEEEIVGGHAEGVVVPCDAFAQHGVEGKAQRTDKGDEIARECRRVLRGHAGGGEKYDAEKRDGHADDFAERGGFEAKEDGENQGVNGAHTDDDGGVCDGGEAQADGEADLFDGDA